MKNLTLADGEYAFMKIIWDNQPLPSASLVALCNEILGWKKSTTYTVLKRLIEKGLLQNENTTITSLVSQRQVQIAESNKLLERTFEGDLPSFFAAFMQGKKLNEKEISHLKELIENYQEKL